ncbi:protein of unknown function [Candidatus Hydrogenisulfobacillus filiaventi]|uniref:Uncharacterized protein n=1 Tax=Candidatus Hydrogenisulfobacillus filiaventi TaxID=2707344 RepID=A0A6F8ZI01_9FIRM|nr:protein of unknown function [Candidatus Hydrogenisulfobacillus filiaventi]
MIPGKPGCRTPAPSAGVRFCATEPARNPVPAAGMPAMADARFLAVVSRLTAMLVDMAGGVFTLVMVYGACAT